MDPQGSAGEPAAAAGEAASLLLARWQEQGDREALEELIGSEVERLKARLRARSSAGAHATASVSDVAQEAVLRLLGVRTSPRFDHPAALRSYLWTAAWRLLAGRLRHAGVAPRTLDTAGSSALHAGLGTTGGLGTVEERERSVALQVAIQLLEPGEQEILELVYFRGEGIEGAARTLGITHEAANGRLVRARKKLAGKLVRWSDRIG